LTTADHGADMTWHPAPHRTATAAASLFGVVLGVALGLGGYATASSASPGTVEVVLPDTEARLSDLVRAVRSAAVGVHGTLPERDLEVVLTTRLPEDADEPGLTGWQRGSTVWVRLEGNATPTTTLLHELAHAVTPGGGHGETFREVYLTAVTEVLDLQTAEKEARRLAWVYDRCYQDDACPVVTPRARPPAPGER
jgi:hypothetical protein